MFCADSIKKAVDTAISVVFAQNHGLVFFLAKYVKHITKRLYTVLYRFIVVNLLGRCMPLSQSSVDLCGGTNVSRDTVAPDAAAEQRQQQQHLVDCVGVSFNPRLNLWRTLLSLPQKRLSCGESRQHNQITENVPLTLSFNYDHNSFRLTQENEIEYMSIEVLRDVTLWREGRGGVETPFCVTFCAPIKLTHVYRKRKEEECIATAKATTEAQKEPGVEESYEKILLNVERYTDSCSFTSVRADTDTNSPLIVANSLHALLPFPQFCDALRDVVAKNRAEHPGSSRYLLNANGQRMYTMNDSGWFTNLVAILHANNIFFDKAHYMCIAQLLTTLANVPLTRDSVSTLFGVILPQAIVLDLSEISTFGMGNYYRESGFLEVVNTLPDAGIALEWIKRQLTAEIVTIANRSTYDDRDAGNENNNYARAAPATLDLINKVTPLLASSGSCNMMRAPSGVMTVRVSLLAGGADDGASARGEKPRKNASEIVHMFHDAIEKCNVRAAQKEALKFIGVGRPSDIYTLAITESYQNSTARQGGSDDSSSDDDEDNGGSGGGGKGEGAKKKGKSRKLHQTATAPGPAAYRANTNANKQLSVETHLVNKTSRSISTVYLRKHDERTLIKAMDNFKHRSDKLRQLGIPNKLGIMLHGMPGTGKSSLIQAVATYLEKDMYYLHLNALRTNTALKKAFDYVVNYGYGEVYGRQLERWWSDNVRE